MFFMLIRTLTYFLLILVSFSPYSSSGQTQFWAHLPSGSGTSVRGMVETFDGNFLVGFEDLATGKGIMKISNSASVLWRLNLGVYPDKILELPDHSVIMAGSYEVAGANSELFLLKMDPNGSVFWFKRYQFPFSISLSDLELTPGGEFLLSGLNLLLKTNGNGDVLWGRQIFLPNNPSSTYFQINSIAYHPENKYLISGYAGGITGEKGFLCYFDPLGNYTYLYNTVDQVPFNDAIVLPDTTIVGVGSGTGLVNQQYFPGFMYVFKQSTNYRKVYSVPNAQNYSISHVVAAGDGGWFVTGRGFSNFGNESEGSITKYNFNDSIVWGSTFFPEVIGNGPYRCNIGQLVGTRDGGAAVAYFMRDWGQFGNYASSILAGDIAGVIKVSGATGPCNTPVSPFAINPSVSLSINSNFPVSILNIIPTTVSGTITPSPVGGGSFVLSQCSVCEEPANADFIYASSGSQFQFTNLGQYGYQYLWDFGDCSTDTIQNPSHNYPTPGQYQVCLMVVTPCDTERVCQRVDACQLANFTGASFACNTTPYTWVGDPAVPNHQWLWDGTPVGTASSITLSGLSGGNHSLIHIAGDGNCQDTVVMPVNVFSGAAVASFYFSYQNHELVATSNSTNAGSWTWDFGDGSAGSGPSVTHNYTSGDTFTVCLTVTNGCSADTFCQVVSCVSVEADMAQSQVGVDFIFTNLSTNATQYLWNFGDGYFSQATNPVHQYFFNGPHSGSLIAMNGCSSDEIPFSVQNTNVELSYFDKVFPSSLAEGVGVVDDGNGGYFIVTKGNIGQLIRMDSFGRILWAKEVYSSAGQIPFADIAMTPDKKLLLIGNRGNIGLVVKTDTIGNIIWEKEVPGTMMEFKKCLVMANGNYAIAGTHLLGGNMGEGCIIVLNPAGNLVQAEKYQNPNGIIVHGFTQTTDGGFMLATTQGLLKVSNSLSYSWQSRDPFMNFYYDVIEKPGVGYYALAYEGTVNEGAYVYKYDLAGNTIWGRYLQYSTGQGARQDMRTIGMDSSGNIVICGKDQGYGGSTYPPNLGADDVAMVVLHPNSGATIYGYVYGSADYEVARDMVINAQDEILMVGYRWPSISGMGVWKKKLSGLYSSACPNAFGWTNSQLSPISVNPVPIANSPLSISFVPVAAFSTPDNWSLGDSCVANCYYASPGIHYLRNGMNVTFYCNSGISSLDFGDGSPVATNVSNITHTYSSFPITACGTRTNGSCGHPVSQCFTINPSSCTGASFTPIAPKFCLNEGAAVTSTSTGSILSKTWLLNGVAVGTGNSLSLSNTVAGNYYLQLVVQYNSCNDTAGAFFQVFDATPIDIGEDLHICNGDTVTFDVNYNGYHYLQWNGVGGAWDYLKVSSPGFIVGTSSENFGLSTCVYRDTILVTMGAPAPPISLGPDVSFCGGFCETLEATPGFVSYTWSHSASNTEFAQVSDTGSYIVTGLDAGGCSSSDTIHVSYGPYLYPSITGVPNICNGNPVTLWTAVPYGTYLWSDGSTGPNISVTSPGVYWVEVTNGSCIGWDTVVVGAATAQIPNIGPDDSICQGGTFPLSAGTGFSSYFWSNGSNTPTTAANNGGYWWVQTTDANGCMARDSVFLTLLPAPVVTFGPNPGLCPGASMVLDAGPGWQSYAWSSGGSAQLETVTNAGSYYVTVTDIYGCEGMDSIHVQFLPQPAPNLGPDTSVCAGASIGLQAGGGFTSYAWSTGATSPNIVVTTPGVYAVTVSNSFGCTGVDWVQVNPGVPAPMANFSFVSNSTAYGFLDVSGGPVNSWYWDFGDGNSSSLQNPNHTFGLSGTYLVCLTVVNDCGTDSICQSVMVIGVDDPMDGSYLSVFPNPTDGHFVARMQFGSSEATQIKVVNTLGQVVYVADLGVVSEYETEVPSDRWAVGVYQVVVFHGGREVRKAIVRR